MIGRAGRYYSPSQANTAEAIRILRQIDHPIDDIGRFLQTDERDVTERILKSHRVRLEERLADHDRMLRYPQSIIAREEGRVMPYSVEVKEVPQVQVAAVRLTTTLARIGEDIQRGFGRLIGFMAATGTESVGAPFVVYHNVIDEETDGDIEMCIPVAVEFDDHDGVFSTRIEGGTVAWTMHRGPYEEIGPAYHTLTGWIQNHGHEMCGPPREVYLNDPTTVPASDLLTEVDWPIS